MERASHCHLIIKTCHERYLDDDDYDNYDDDKIYADADDDDDDFLVKRTTHLLQCALLVRRSSRPTRC